VGPTTYGVTPSEGAAGATATRPSRDLGKGTILKIFQSRRSGQETGIFWTISPDFSEANARVFVDSLRRLQLLHFSLDIKMTLVL
jgi:hypothetical protein